MDQKIKVIENNINKSHVLARVFTLISKNKSLLLDFYLINSNNFHIDTKNLFCLLFFTNSVLD